MEEADNFKIVEGAVTEGYGLGEETPVVITYGMPDWMLFPSGNMPPLTISTSHELHRLLTDRPWLTEVTILVVLGARSVAEYNFLRRSSFTIGLTTYVVDETHDERENALFHGAYFNPKYSTFICGTHHHINIM